MTTFINIFAGPGTGKSKSITASLLFSAIRQRGISAELITEFAKERVWAGDKEALNCQPYITGNQIYRQFIVNNKVDYAITDAPILLGAIYRGFGFSAFYEKALLHQFGLFRNTNILLIRNKEKYEQEGRVQSLEQAVAIDNQIKRLLDINSIPYLQVAMSLDNSHIQSILDYAIV